MIGTKFGRWTILENIRHLGELAYKCICECGDIYPVLKVSFKKGSSQCKPCYLNNMAQPMINNKFGKLTVKSFSHSTGLSKYYLCICECGEQRICNGSNLRRGMTRQCLSCRFKMYKTHGMKGTSTYNIWRGMIDRCNNIKCVAYPRYGGRGIKVIESWMQFENFLADMGVRPIGMQIDRKNNDKGYFKENCHWVTPKQNCKNRRIKARENRKQDNT